MIRRIVGLCFGWLILTSGGWLLPSATAASCYGRPGELVISAPTTLAGLRLSGQRVRIAAPLTITGALEGCAASLELLPGASLTAASIDLTAGQATLDRGSLRSAGPLLLASQRLIVSDGPGQPLLISGDGRVELTGADALDLRAVGDRSSMIRAGGDLVLRSGRPIRGDAHYLAGGAVRMETLEGAPADVFSPDDPIVLARFDVSLGNYSGASLHVLAGGRVLLGDVTINAADAQTNSINPANTTLFNATTRIQAMAPAQLSTGEVITVAGNLRPTLDVRAGIDWASLGGLTSNQIIPGGSVAPSFGGAISSAAIVAGNINITAPTGVALLTNQYRPRAGLSGDITTGNIVAASSTAGANGGDIWIDSRGGVAAGQLRTFATAGGSGGSIWVRAAAGTIATGALDSSSTASGDTGAGGPITVAAPAGSVQITGAINTSTNTGGGQGGAAGEVSIAAGGAITGKPPIFTYSTGATGSASGGAVSLTSSGPINVDVIQTYSQHTTASLGGSGNGGAITLLARNAGAINGTDAITVNYIYAFSGSYFSAAGGPSSGGGAVSMRAEDGPINVTNFIWTPSVARGGANPAGNAGPVALTAGNGGITIGDFGIGAYTQVTGGSGNAGRGGNVSLVASGPILVDATKNLGGINTSSNSAGNSFGGGNVLVITNQGAVSFGANNIDTRASSNAGSAGNAGNVTIMGAPGSAGSIKFNAVVSDSIANSGGASAGSAGRISLNGGGPILINDSLYARSQGGQGVAGSGGDVVITTAATATLNTINTYVDSLNGSGDGGDISIETTGRLKLTNILGWTRFTGSGYSGDAGDTRITVHNSGAADGADDLELGVIWSDSGTWYSGSASGPSGDGGDSILAVEDGDTLISQWLWGQSQARGAAFASGNGGAVSIRASGQIKFGDFGINTISQSLNGAAGSAGAVSLDAGGDITYVTTIGLPAINASASGSGGAGGPVTITTPGSIDFGSQGVSSTATSGAGSSGDGGPISISAGPQATAAISTGALLSYSQGGQDSGDGGVVSVQGGRVSTGSILASTQATSGLSGDGGAITIRAGGDLTLPASGQVSAGSSASTGATGSGGAIVIEVQGAIVAPSVTLQTATRTISGPVGPAGDLSVSAGGAIEVGPLNTSAVRSSGQNGAAGDIRIETPSSLSASYADASSGGAQPGAAGTVEISAGQLVLLTGAPSGASVLATGMSSTGAISITHGGAGITPFIVGDAATNGSAGGLLTGAAAINPTRSFLYSYTEAPNIHIISVPPPALGLSKTVAPVSPAPFHGALTYTLTISNTGSALAAGAMLTDTLPLGLQFASWVEQPAGASAVGNTVTWSGAVAQNATIRLSFVAVHTGSAGQTLTNTAQLSYGDSLLSASASATIGAAPGGQGKIYLPLLIK